MFDSSFFLLIKVLLIHLLLPIIPWILFFWIFFGKRFWWTLLYFLSWIIGMGVIAMSLFNFQFIHFGVWIWAYFVLLMLLLAVFLWKIFLKKETIKDYLPLLKPEVITRKEIKASFFSLSKFQKVFTLCWGVFSFLFLATTFVFRISLPTYGDDSFGNWNSQAINIYHDGGVKLFGNKDEILTRWWRMWYPFYVSIYKATASDFFWSFNDIYINVWQWLAFLTMILFSFYITRKETKNIFLSVLPSILICWLPLVFFHSIEGYMEMPCTIYSVFTIRAFWKFLTEKDYGYLSLWFLLGFILCNIKNDWLLWYFAWIFLGLIFILLISQRLIPTISEIFKKKTILFQIIFFGFYFFLPFIFIKRYHNLWFNQSVSSSWEVLSSSIHREIFSIFKHIFFGMDNYNIALLPIIFLWLFLYIFKRKELTTLYLFLAPATIFSIFILVFLLTENYQFVMNQLTVNRVFTMVFVVLFAFIWLLLSKNEPMTHNHKH